MPAATPFSENKSSGGISRAVVALYAVAMALTLSMPLILVWMVYSPLWTSGPDLWSGNPPSGAVLLARVGVLRALLLKLWWAKLLLITAANGAFTVWLYVVLKGLRAKGARVRFAPHWAITGFFVPILNFVRPYQVVADAWRCADSLQGGGGSAPIPWRIKLWWAFILTNIVVVGLGGRASQPGFMELTLPALAALGATLMVLALSIGVVALIERETQGRREGSAGPVSQQVGWGLPALASVGSVAIAGLFTLGVYAYTAWQVHKIAETGLAFFEQPFVPRPTPPSPAAKSRPEAPPAAAEPGYAAPQEIVDFVPAVELGGVPDGMPGGVEGGVPGDVEGGVLGGVIGGTPGSGAPAGSPTIVRLSGKVASDHLLRSARPTYPPLAKQARIWGVVTLEVKINKEGGVTSAQTLSGHPLLQEAAVDAVRKWTYRPYLVKGEPVEVITTVIVIFRLEE
jgi:protein TonB